MRGKKEKILLDAMVAAVIHSKVLTVELENGHRLTAVHGRENGNALRCGPGEMVRVQLSPCDMSRGIIVGRAVKQNNCLEPSNES